MLESERAAVLIEAIDALPVVVDEVASVVTEVAVPTYPGGWRPTATVTLGGAGVYGIGEHVAWARTDHDRFAADALANVPRGRATFGAWARALGDRFRTSHARAAVEAAGLDLALRQAGTNLFGLLGLVPRPVRYVISFTPRADPVAEIRRWQSFAPGIAFKVDVDLAWSAAVYRDLAATAAIATLDFKGRGAVAEHERAHRYLPGAWIEDPAPAGTPWSPGLAGRVSVDAAVTSAAALDRLPTRPAAVNVKPARLGGIGEALRCVAACRSRDLYIYIGGMFEVGIGRQQLWTLAALLASDAPNDIAPLTASDTGAADLPAALAVDVTVPGFGAPLCAPGDAQVQ
jgi:L-alanine-DL-glutamate epimerase-like enolase superfamily enzyme